MFRAQLPRLYELLDLIADPASPKAYFQDFETKLQVEPLCLPVYACWEKVFQILDEDAWKALKDEAAQYLSCRDKRRGWHQLFDILGQADAYKPTPSCVPTVNIRHARSRANLDYGFFRKLQSDITCAKDQMHGYDPTGEARHLVYITICFDDWVGYYRGAYFSQIDQYLKDNPIPEIEVVFSASR